MTEAQARTTANVVLAAAVIGAVYYVLKTPPLRRKVSQMARSWAAGPLVVWTATEIRRAWDSTAPDFVPSTPSRGSGVSIPRSRSGSIPERSSTASARPASSAPDVAAAKPASAVPHQDAASARQA
jgi:hypothetical protein